MGSLINDEDLVRARLGIYNNASDGNAAYSCQIIDRQSRYRSRDREVVVCCLIEIDNGHSVIRGTKLAPDTYKRKIADL